MSSFGEKSRPAGNGVNTVAKNETAEIQTLSQASTPVADRSFLTPHQQENERIKEGILDNMCAGTDYSIADMLCTFDCFPENMTPNRLSALLSQLGPMGTGQIERIEQKGKVYYTLPSNQGPAQVNPFRAENIEDTAAKAECEIHERKLTPYQLENENIKLGILDNMTEGTIYSIADMLCTFDCFPENMTSNRLSALLSQLGPSDPGQIDRVEEKGKLFFLLNENGKQRKATITQDYRANIGTDHQLQTESTVHSNTRTAVEYGSQYSYGTSANSKEKQKREYYTDWDGRKYYYDKNDLKKYKQERTYYTDCDGWEYYYNKNGEKKYRAERKKKAQDPYDDPLNDPIHYNNFQNGATDHGTFIGNCKICGATWDFPSYKVIPRPYPHATCPKCHNWVAVF